MKRKLILWLMQTKTYSWALKHIIPFIRFSVYYTKFPGVKFYIAYDKLRPGDIVVSVDPKKLTSLLIPGDWAHAGVCVSKDKVFEIAEMTHKDYTKSTFFDFCKESERIAIFRCTDFDPPYTAKFVDNVKGFEGALYDTLFGMGIIALYCSELPYQADDERRMQVSLDDLAGLGRPYISPTGLTRGKNMVCIYDSSWTI